MREKLLFAVVPRQQEMLKPEEGRQNLGRPVARCVATGTYWDTCDAT